jgi:hypothetical protein
MSKQMIETALLDLVGEEVVLFSFEGKIASIGELKISKTREFCVGGYFFALKDIGKVSIYRKARPRIYFRKSITVL